MNIHQLFDEQPLSGLQLRVIGICFLLNMLDGIDVLAISFAAPLISQEWAITPQALGIVFSAALVGMAIGAVVISPHTDRIGRRNMILISIVLIAVGMIATGYARSVAQLAALRLVAGLGIGSMLASLTSMVSEYAPERHRNLAILVLHAAYPIGAILAGFVAAWVMPDYGWRPIFIFAGVVSLLALPVVLFSLPESLHFLTRTQPAGALEKANRILASMNHPPLPALPDNSQERVAESGVKALFRPHLKTATLLLWLAFMMSFATLYFLFSWVVKLAVESGLGLANAMYAGISLNLGAFFGSITLGLLSSRLGLKRVITLFLVAGAVMSIVYGNAAGTVPVSAVLLLLFLLMYFVQGGFTGLYAVAARLYPTEIRTTGVGWAIGAGRTGAIMGPSVAGFILGAGVPIGWTFVIFGAPLLLAGIAMSRLSNSSIH